jgi:UDP-N-acetylmuramate--alanine ligase
MVTDALVAAGRDPTGIAGGLVPGWGGNARLGGDELFVAEADEFDRAFLALDPSVAVVNNVEADHLECYGSVGELEAAFGEFARRAQRVIVGADDAGAGRVGTAVDVPTWSVGVGPSADVRIGSVRRDQAGSAAVLTLPGGGRVELQLQVPGLHNVRNAAMAVATALALGADTEAAASGLAAFTGVARRFEVIGSARGVTVVDDYAHHPTEVAVTIGAARQRFPDARLVAVFQPHLYSRTRQLGAALGIALSAADRVVVTEIFPAREEPVAGVSGESVVNAARRAGAEVDWVPEREQVASQVAAFARDGDVVLVLGAGDITKAGPELLERLSSGA